MRTQNTAGNTFLTGPRQKKLKFCAQGYSGFWIVRKWNSFLKYTSGNFQTPKNTNKW